ncbi:MAG: helix-hairpin-helix domain-containing protein [Aphanocapsa lilacina HA4352-LM1]|jgi:hypothetical protein|nr:helix-hairpin-helix domain-containing protein [Aphanocapsa lilacina HA4352-LM1]
MHQTVVRRLLPLVAITALLIACAAETEAPKPTATASTPATESMAMGGGRKVNINTAILSELDKFEGLLAIPALSNRIQAARPYASPEELVSKNVLTQEQFDRIKDQVTVEEIVLTGRERDVDYLTKLGLMRGHLIVARELIERQQPEHALPHFGHPVEEIYLDIEEQLAERQVPEFKSALLKLQDLVKFKPDSPEIAPGLSAAFAAIDKAEQAIPAAGRTQPAMVLGVIDGLLEAAAAEYSAAVNNGKIAARIEYEDSRGFVLYAGQLYATIGPQLDKADPKTAEAIAVGLRKLAGAWPSIEAPNPPALSAEEVAASVKSVEQAAQKFAT